MIVWLPIPPSEIKRSRAAQYEHPIALSHMHYWKDMELLGSASVFCMYVMITSTGVDTREHWQ